MKFVLEIRLGNDAMQTLDDVSRSLHSIAGDLARNGIPHPPRIGEFSHIQDNNGNTVGEWRVKQSRPKARD